MELFRGNKDSSLSYVMETITNKNIELEVIFGVNEHNNPLNRNIFMKLLETCKTDYQLISEESVLDIRHEYRQGGISNIRCSVDSIDSIKHYCKTDSLDDISTISFISKGIHKSEDGTVFQTIRDEDYNLRLTLKDEIQMGASDPRVIQYRRIHESSKKHFRYKKRFSFLTQDKVFRIDLTVIKSTKKEKGVHNLKKTFREANILSQPEAYELEIEYIGDKKGIGNYDHDRLYTLLQEQHDILVPGQRIQGNNYDPLHTRSPFSLDTDYDVDYSPDEGIMYDIEEPRYVPKLHGIPQHSVNYTQTEYSKLIGKYIRIKDQFWYDNPSITYLREKLNKAYDAISKQLFHIPRMDGIIIDIQEIHQEETSSYETFANVSFYPEIEDIRTLLIPLKYIYSHTFEITDTEILTKEGDETEYPAWISEKGIVSEDVKITLSRKLILLLKDHIVHLSKIIYDTDTLLSHKVKHSVLEIYKRLTWQVKNSYFTLKGPQPVSLDQKDINIHSHNNILVDYAVTEKADGERYQLLITRNRGYLINSKQHVIDTGNTFDELNGEWLLDGEYITRDKDNKSIQLFMAFDVYWNGGETPQPIHTYPFLEYNQPVLSDSDMTNISRYLTLLRFQTETYSARKSENAITIDVKEYEVGFMNEDRLPINQLDNDQLLEIFESSKRILLKSEEGHYSYRIDGLIYIPLKLSVGSSIEGSPMKNIGGEWKYNYKWKPPEENTIDFLVKTVKQSINGSLIDQTTPMSELQEGGQKKISEYKQLGLYVGYDKSQDTTIDYCMGVLDGYKMNLTNDKVILFSPEGVTNPVNQTNIILDGGRMLCSNFDRDEIRDGDIVEMRYNGNGEDSLWTPLRVRRDKLKPQFFITSYKIWNTIQNPITPEMIQGGLKHKFLTGTQSIKGEYYVSDKGQLSEMESLRKFHNMIKKKLIIGISSLKKNPKILDLSCGRGGDIQKVLHKDIKPSFILGIDISGNVSEACKRFYEEKTKVKGVFIRGDTSQNIRSGKCVTIPDITDKERIHSETMIKIMYGKDTDTIPEQYGSIIPKYENIVKDGFDVISSQFSIHYYFKDQKTLNGFIQNINENVSSGGYFIGTCYDGMKVFDLEETILEMKDSVGNLLYRIEKKYSLSDFTFNESDQETMLGNEIDVYMESIGQSITEYLVNFDYLTHIMKENGFKLVTPQGIKSPYSSIFKGDYMTNGMGDFESIVNDLQSFKDGNDSDYSPKIDPIMYNEGLQKLTSLNKFFVFQKE